MMYYSAKEYKFHGSDIINKTKMFLLNTRLLLIDITDTS